MASPVLDDDTFVKEVEGYSGKAMTLRGAVEKTAILGGICFGTGWIGWGMMATGWFPYWMTWILAGLALVLVIAIAAKPARSPVLAPYYAGMEGVLLGAVSWLYEAEFDGIVLQALLSTAAVFFAMLGAYRLGWLRPSRKFIAIVIAATLGVALIYAVHFVLSLFGSGLPFVSGEGNGPMIFSGIICIIAALNLILDFGRIEEGAMAKAPQYMEWYSAFALLVTIIWLYIEILRFLAKFRKRD
mgnify:CR=1 FL=1